MYAKEHFEQFIAILKKVNMMPPWWNEHHEEAIWRIACDMDSPHCLAYPLDADEVKNCYDDGVAHKVTLLAEAAAAEDLAQESGLLQDLAGRENDYDFEEELKKLRERIDDENMNDTGEEAFYSDEDDDDKETSKGGADIKIITPLKSDKW